MSIFTILNQPVAILVEAFSKLIKVTNDRFIFYIILSWIIIFHEHLTM